MDFVNDNHKRIVEALNAAVIASGEPPEGNLYYTHHQNLRLNTTLNPYFVRKRQQLHEIVKHKTSVLEIGFNAGHSAALMLCSNPEIFFFACFRYFKDLRKNSIRGRSMETGDDLDVI